MNKTEARIQQEIVVWFRNNHCLKHHRPRCVIFSVPNERQSREERIRLFNTGTMPGVSDLIVGLPNAVAMYVEVKTEEGVQSKEQKEFERTVTDLGFTYVVVRSLEDFQTHIAEYVKKC